MSSESTVVTARHFAYIAARTLQEDDWLRRLRAAALREEIPEIQIAAEQAAFLQILLRLCKAREVVEVGTLAGYSAICMARALPPGGRVRTIEILDKHADFAERWIAESDVATKVEIWRGAGTFVLPKFGTASADAAFLDADKANYPNYLRECMRIVKPGGLIMADNAFAFGQLFDEHPTDREAPAMRAFNDLIAKTPGLTSIIVPFGDGLWVGVRGE